MNSFSSHIKKITSLRLLSILLFFALFGAYAYTSAIASPYQPAQTRDPACAPGEINCFVQIIPSQTGNSGKFLSTDGTTTVWTSAVSGGSFANATFTNAPTFATLTGVVKANGASPATAMNGTANYVTRWTDANTIGTGVLYDNATNVGVGTATPAALFSVGATSPFTVTNLGAVSALSLSLGGGTALGTTNQTGTGSIVMSTSPALVTPNIGAATASSLTVSSGGDIVLPGGNFGISNPSTRFLTVATGVNPALTFTSSATSFSGSVTGGAASFTTGAFAGTITNTMTSGNIFAAASATTASLYTYMANTSGTLFTGVESSTAGAIFPGTTAYASVIGNTGNKPLQFATQNAVRMTIDGSGNVGVGLSTVHSQITVGGSAAQTTAALTDAGTRAGLIEVLGAGGTAGNGGGIVLGVDTIGAGAGYGQTAIKSLLTSGAGNGTADLAFATRNATTDTALTERMRITAGGNVGIGTTSPAATLDITGTLNTSNKATIQTLTIGLGGATSVATNTAFGYQTLNSASLTAGAEVAVGYQAGSALTTGGSNALFGYGAGKALTTGSGNTAIGTSALIAGTAASDNVFIGNSVAFNATTANQNVAIGEIAMQTLVGGAFNTAVGQEAMTAMGGGITYNTALGYRAGRGAAGIANTALGTQALYTGGDGTGHNIAVGYTALYNTTSNYNIGIGDGAGLSITTGSGNVVLGGYSAAAFPTATNNIFLADGTGNLRMRVDSSGNVGIGTATPGAKLDIVSDSFASGLTSLTANTGLYGRVRVATSGATLYYGVEGTTAGATITGSSASESFLVASGTLGLGGGGTAAHLTILSSGNVGIGTTTPSNARLVIGGSFDNSGAGASVATSGLQVTTSLTPANAAVAPGRSIYGLYANLGTMTGINAAANNTFADIAITPATVSLTGGATLTNHIGLYIDSAPAGASNNYAVYSTAGTNYFGGNVGIGTTSPGGRLDIVPSADSPIDGVIVERPATPTQKGIMSFSGGALQFTSYDTGAALGTAQQIIFNQRDNTTSREVMRINAAGNLGIGTTSPTYKLDISGTTTSELRLVDSGDVGFQLVANATVNAFSMRSSGGVTYLSTENNYPLVIGVSSSTGPVVAANTGIYINPSGNLGITALAAATASTLCYNTTTISTYNTVGTCSSDQRLKQNITPLGDDVVANIMKLNPVSYNWNPAFATDPTTQYGLIAQEVATIFPNLVSKTAPTPLTPDGTYSVNFNGLYAPIIKSIQEMNITVTNLSSLDTTKAMSLGSLVKQFLGDTANTLGAIYADTLNARQRICVDGECLTKDDVHALLQLAHPVIISAPSIPTPPVAAPAPAPTPTTPSAPTPTTSATLPASTLVTPVTSTTTAITTTPTSTPSAPVVSPTPPASPTPAPTPTTSTTPPAATTQPQPAPVSAPTAPSTATTPPAASAPTPAPTPAPATP